MYSKLKPSVTEKLPNYIHRIKYITCNNDGISTSFKHGNIKHNYDIHHLRFLLLFMSESIYQVIILFKGIIILVIEELTESELFQFQFVSKIFHLFKKT